MHENSEVKIRFMELICFVANFSAMHDLMKTSGKYYSNMIFV